MSRKGKKEAGGAGPEGGSGAEAEGSEAGASPKKLTRGQRARKNVGQRLATSRAGKSAIKRVRQRLPFHVASPPRVCG